MSAIHARCCTGARNAFKNATPCGGTFRCSSCKRTVGWCKGCSDDYGKMCDECAVKHFRAAERRAKGGER
jgi:hypothetical protein